MWFLLDGTVNVHCFTALYTWTSILVVVDRVEFVLCFTGRHDRADTKIVVFSISTAKFGRDSVPWHYPYHYLYVYAKICREKASYVQ
jgi:hypothetical protein